MPVVLRCTLRTVRYIEASSFWTIRDDESLCFVCKEAKDDYIIFFLSAPIFVRILIHFGKIWTYKLQTAVLQMVVRFLLLLRISTKTVKLCCF